MYTRPRWWRTLVCTAAGLAAVGLTLGCGGKKSTGPAGDELVIEPTVTVNDTQSFRVESACIGKSGTESNWVYGVVKIEYLGATGLSFVEVTAAFKDKKGRTLFEDDSYIDNLGVCGISSSVNTNTFLTPENSTGYYCLIEDLEDRGIELSQIARLDLTLTGDSYNYLPPGGHLRQVGTAYRTQPEAWHQNVSNDGDVAVKAGFVRFIFADDQDRTFRWAFADSYVGGAENSTYGVGTAGELVADDVTPDYLTSPLVFVTALLDWDTVAAGKLAVAKPTLTGSPRTDEEVKLMAERRDRLEKANSLAP
jgi:hypothetical protein